MRHVKNLRSPPAFPGHQRLLGPAGTRPASRPDSGAPGSALHDGRHPYRSDRPHEPAWPLCSGRSGLHGRPWAPTVWPRTRCWKVWSSVRVPPSPFWRMVCRLSRKVPRSLPPCRCPPAEEALLETHIADLQRGMWAYAGLLREESTLRQGFAAQQACASALDELVQQGKGSRRLAEARALSRVARAILHAALGPDRKPRRAFPQRLSPARRRPFPEALKPAAKRRKPKQCGQGAVRKLVRAVLGQGVGCWITHLSPPQARLIQSSQSEGWPFFISPRSGRVRTRNVFQSWGKVLLGHTPVVVNRSNARMSVALPRLLRLRIEPPGRRTHPARIE